MEFTNENLRARYEALASLKELMRLTGLSQREVTKRLKSVGTIIRPQGYTKGKPYSEEAKRKVSEATRGKRKNIKDKDAWCEIRRRVRQGKKPALGMRHSEETRRKFSEARRGEKNGRWIDGRKQTPYPPEWNKRLRAEVRTAQNYLCGLCNQPGDRPLNVHHIDGNKRNCAHDNLIALCATCHGKAHRKKPGDASPDELRRRVASFLIIEQKDIFSDAHLVVFRGKRYATRTNDRTSPRSNSS